MHTYLQQRALERHEHQKTRYNPLTKQIYRNNEIFKKYSTISKVNLKNKYLQQKHDESYYVFKFTV